MKVEIYDNGGETIDRYTVIVGQSVMTMGNDTTSPQGFNQYAGELSELPFAREGKKLNFMPDSVYDGLVMGRGFRVNRETMEV